MTGLLNDVRSSNTDGIIKLGEKNENDLKALLRKRSSMKSLRPVNKRQSIERLIVSFGRGRIVEQGFSSNLKGSVSWHPQEIAHTQ